MPKKLNCRQGKNNLIATMLPDDRALLLPHLEPVSLERGMVLEERNSTVDTVYFPFSGVASMVAIGKAGQRIEVALYGRDGMSGISVLSESNQSPNETFMQVGGEGVSIRSDILHDLLRDSDSMQTHLLRFFQVIFTQTSHTALANGHAKLEERLARWLLMCHDRIDGDELELTHEFLSVMLGVRRAGVTVGIHVLEGNGHIQASRGRIQILNREGLESAAERSYGVPEEEYERLIG